MIRIATDKAPEGEFDKMLSERIQQFIDAQNNEPDPEMGGLSPNQVWSLLHLDWDTEDCPIKLNKSLTIDDLRDSDFLHNVRTFLNILLEMKDVDTATATSGNLNRKVVKTVLDQMRLGEKVKEEIRILCKTGNEQDVKALHIMRVVCECAGLIRRRKKRFSVLNKHVPLLSHERAGDLFYLLFLAYFRKFNLGYYDGLPELRSIQDAITYAFYRLQTVADDYVPMKGLAERILLLAALKEVSSLPLYSKFELALSLRVIEPLESLGLIECLCEEDIALPVVTSVRKTELFDKFIRFEW